MVRAHNATSLAATPGSEEVARLIEAGRAAERRSDYAAALRAYERALKSLANDPLTNRQVDVLRYVGMAYRELGQTERAEHFFRSSLAAAEACGYVGGVAHAVNWLAVLAVRRGMLGEAEDHFQIAARRAKDAGDGRLLGMIEQNLGVLANIRGDLDGALVRYRAALAGFRAVNDLDMVASVLNNIGVMQRDLKQFVEAETSFAEAHAVAVSVGNAAVANAVTLNQAELDAARARWADVARIGLRAEREAHRLQHRPREAEALRLKAMVARESGRLADAERHLGEANAICVDTEDRLLEAQIARDLGEVLRRQGREQEARAALTRAGRLLRDMGATLELQEVENVLSRFAAVP